VTGIVTTRLPPAAIVAVVDVQVQIVVPVQLKPVGLAPKVRLVGLGVMMKPHAPAAAPTAPMLSILNVYVFAIPAIKFPVCVSPLGVAGGGTLSMSRSIAGAPTMAKDTGSVALLFAVFAGGSPPPETVALLVNGPALGVPGAVTLTF